MSRSRIRVVIPCGTEQKPTRHRWKLEEHYHSTPNYLVFDDRCQKCGRWRTDVLDVVRSA